MRESCGCDIVVRAAKARIRAELGAYIAVGLTCDGESLCTAIVVATAGGWGYAIVGSGRGMQAAAAEARAELGVVHAELPRPTPGQSLGMQAAEAGPGLSLGSVKGEGNRGREEGPCKGREREKWGEWPCVCEGVCRRRCCRNGPTIEGGSDGSKEGAATAPMGGQQQRQEGTAAAQGGG